MNSAEKLKKLREQRGLTQEQLINDLPRRIAISTLRNYESTSNPRIPTMKNLKMLAKFYDVDIGYIIDDSIENTTHGKSKELQLSDESIKKLNNINNSSALNLFIKYANIADIIERISNIYKIQKILSYIHILDVWSKEIGIEHTKMIFTNYSPKEFSKKQFPMSKQFKDISKHIEHFKIEKADYIAYCACCVEKYYYSSSYSLFNEHQDIKTLKANILYILSKMNEIHNNEIHEIPSQLHKRLVKTQQIISIVQNRIRDYQMIERYRIQNDIDSFNNMIMMADIFNNKIIGIPTWQK